MLIYYHRNLISRDYAKYYDREGKAGSAPGYTGTTRGCARLSVDQYTFVEEGLRGALGSRARSANKVPARAEGPRLTYFVLYTKISTLPISLFLWTNYTNAPYSLTKDSTRVSFISFVTRIPYGTVRY